MVTTEEEQAPPYASASAATPADHPLARVRDHARKLTGDALDARAHLGEVHHARRVDAEAIHDFRVALRRLRSALRPLGLAWGKKRMDALAERIRTVADATGELRDEEVLRETLADLELDAVARETLTKWQVGRARRERGLRARVVATLIGADDLPQVLADIQARVESEPKHARTAEALARDALERAVHKLEHRARGADPDDKLAMHKVRIAAKQLRYTAELFDGVGDTDWAKIAKSAAKLQKRLGTLHDLDEAMLRMGRAYGLPRPARDAVLGALARARAHVQKKCEGDIPEELSVITHLARR
jgi:CHAD domain-containing protein